jgi:hypothetical protein
MNPGKYGSIAQLTNLYGFQVHSLLFHIVVRDSIILCVMSLYFLSMVNGLSLTVSYLLL